MTQEERKSIFEEMQEKGGFILEEIAEAFNMSFEDLIQWIATTYNKDPEMIIKHNEIIKTTNIKLAQFEMALYDYKMAIWWGKQYLGQTDKGLINQKIETTQQPNETHQTIIDKLATRINLEDLEK